MQISKIKSIKDLEIELPTDRGLYAITGQNGSGKSTIVTCAASAFYNMYMNDYFGVTAPDSSICFNYDGSTKSWFKDNGRWKTKSDRSFKIRGFYEGSLIFGSRFKNTNIERLRKLDRINTKALYEADDFIREHLGEILHNNEGYYDKILYTNIDIEDDKKNDNFRENVFYYTKGDTRVSQFHMSTGENLLISILNSINIRNNDRKNLDKPCLLFLDEIELALHPSSLKRLTAFLRKISKEYNYSIYFSTHSIELISGIKPDNIYFIERHFDDSIEILNPCYPAYATRILFDNNGHDIVIMVEDDLARSFIDKILRKYSLRSNKLIHVLPCGGFRNVIDLANEVVSSKLTNSLTKIIIILDGDVREEAIKYKTTHPQQNNISLSFLPIESLEKFLKKYLVTNVDHKLFRLLNDYIFHQKSLTEIVSEYKKADKKGSSGKTFYKFIDNELRERNKSREEIVEIIVDYLIENDQQKVEKIVNFLKRHF